jgi:hypothetical protein
LRCDEKFVRDLKLDKHVSNPSCRESALYLIDEYLQAQHMDSKSLVNFYFLKDFLVNKY